MRSSLRLACFAFAVVFVAACGSNTAPRATGPAVMAILAGNNQTAPVAAASFPNPVQGQLYRAPNGQVAFRWLDALLPATAAAGTTVTVNGAPITNAVVCWADVPGAPRLIPFSVCTNTDNNGKASFSIRPDTAAGKAKGQIHWDSAGTPIVTDSVLETVTPGPADPMIWQQSWLHTSPDTLIPSLAYDQYKNNIPYRVVGDSVLHVMGDTAGTVAARTVTFTTPAVDQPYRYTNLVDSAGTVLAVLKYKPYVNGQLEATACGTGRVGC